MAEHNFRFGYSAQSFRGRPPNTGERAQRLVRACGQRSGSERLHLAFLRHTFASRLVMAGVDLRTVQEAMGHKTIQVVRYAHLTPKHQLAALERLCETDGALDRATATRTATNADSGQADDQCKIN